MGEAAAWATGLRVSANKPSGIITEKASSGVDFYSQQPLFIFVRAFRSSTMGRCKPETDTPRLVDSAGANMAFSGRVS